MGDSLTWDDDGAPRSGLYDDVYFSADGGLAESRAVFLAGCGLPEAWAGRARFVVGELGFGTGLNIAALLALWRETRPPGARLSVFSVEAHPLARDEAARALAVWPDLVESAGALLAQWPGRARGFHRIALPDLAATVDVAVMDAAEALGAWDGRADAWFLDGFAPARNPAMWSEAVLTAVAGHSAPGARAATYTVAGAVRRGLAASGFTVERRPGFGRKRERLEARLPGAPVESAPRPRVAIVGAGIAGASLARALRRLGVEPRIFDAAGPGAGASGNPAALVTPRLDAGLGPPAALFSEAFRRAVALYAAEPGVVIARGAVQLETQDRDAGRFERIAAADLFEPGSLRRLTSDEASLMLGEPAAGGLMIEDALVVEPAPLLEAWLGAVEVGRVAALGPDGRGAWRLLDSAGGLLAEADLVFLAAAIGTADLAPGLTLQAIRGQASFAADIAPTAAAFGGYAIPTRTGVLFGATHDRDDSGADIRPADHTRNLATLALGLPRLAERLSGLALEGRAGVRATTPDRLPLAGPVPGAPGVHVLAGLGSRGFCLAPLLAEHVAARALGAPSPVQAALSRLVDPQRQHSRRSGVAVGLSRPKV